VDIRNVRYIEKGLFLLWLALIAFLILLRDLILINIRDLPFDDGLFIGRAESLIGNTEKSLGSTRGFNPLVKGQIYPFIVATSNFLNLNPITFVFIVYVISISVLIFLFFRQFKEIILIFSVIIFVLTDPSPFSAQASRISREFSYEIFVFILFLIFILLKFRYYENKNKLGLFSFIPIGASIGLIMFLANNTREERPWIYLIWIVGILWLFCNSTKTIKPLVILATVTFLTYSMLTLNLMNYNKNIFGVKLTSTTIEGEFPRLMSNLASIDVSENYNPYVSISESKRKIAYDNSPSFNLLKDYLEGDGKAWIQFGCENSQTCEDYANGWFHVALRVAIDNIGYWITQQSAQEFMQEINNELEAACGSGKIECSRALPLAKALGVTTITGDQLIQSLNFLKLYVNNSIYGWSQSAQEHSPYVVLDEKQWQRWSFVIKALPDSQIQYQNKYNHRVSLFNPVFEKWMFTYKFINLVGILSLFFICFRLIFYKSSFRKNELLLASIAFYSLFIWLSRGALLAVNSTTNFISVTENYALPGRVFLPIALSIFSYLGVREIMGLKNGK
jgi:hypothetical protein